MRWQHSKTSHPEVSEGHTCDTAEAGKIQRENKRETARGRSLTNSNNTCDLSNALHSVSTLTGNNASAALLSTVHTCCFIQCIAYLCTHTLPSPPGHPCLYPADAQPSSAAAPAAAAAAAPAGGSSSSGDSFPAHEVLKMPALSPTMSQGNIISWNKKVRVLVQWSYCG
jgi:hypothetical protein